MVSRNGSGKMAADGPPPKGPMRFKLYSRTPFYIIGGATALMLSVRLVWPAFGPELMLNYTHSEPYGIYRLDRIPTGQLTRGMMVAFPVPESFKDLVVERGWVNAGHPLMKQIGALAGDEVCVSDSDLTINGQHIGPIFAVDSVGRPMPSVRGCMRIKAGEFFPLSIFNEKSFDGRYIGAVPLSAITGKLEPVWTF